MREPQPQPVFTADQIQFAVQKVAVEVKDWLKISGANVLNLVCVLEGARFFARDLNRALKDLSSQWLIREHFIRVQGTQGHELLETRSLFDEALDAAVLTRDPVLIVDDLLDSGKTLEAVRKHLVQMGAREQKAAVLIQKYESSEVPVDFCGLALGLRREDLAAKGLRDCWLFGYGMDWDGCYRDLDYVAWVEVK
ncbi:MAG: phosphoribosyltransferase [bacterium]